jgi:outer membrane lipoprotein SlyB
MVFNIRRNTSKIKMKAGIPNIISGGIGGLVGAAKGFASGGPVGAITGAISGAKGGIAAVKKLKDAGVPFLGRRGKKKTKGRTSSGRKRVGKKLKRRKR